MYCYFFHDQVSGLQVIQIFELLIVAQLVFLHNLTVYQGVHKSPSYLYLLRVHPIHSYPKIHFNISFDLQLDLLQWTVLMKFLAFHTYSHKQRP